MHIYRLLATGTIDEKIFQRQIAKQGLGVAIDAKQGAGAGAGAEALGGALGGRGVVQAGQSKSALTGPSRSRMVPDSPKPSD